MTKHVGIEDQGLVWDVPTPPACIGEVSMWMLLQYRTVGVCVGMEDQRLLWDVPTPPACIGEVSMWMLL